MSDYEAIEASIRGEMALDELKDQIYTERNEIIASLEYITKYMHQNGWGNFSKRYLEDAIVELKSRQQL